MFPFHCLVLCLLLALKFLCFDVHVLCFTFVSTACHVITLCFYVLQLKYCPLCLNMFVSAMWIFFSCVFFFVLFHVYVCDIYTVALLFYLCLSKYKLFRAYVVMLQIFDTK